MYNVFSSLMSRFKARRQEEKIKRSDEITFRGKRHPSAGMFYDVEFDETFFDVRMDAISNCNPMSRDKRGADGKDVTFTLIPLRKGHTTVTEVTSYLGDVTRTPHMLRVK